MVNKILLVFGFFDVLFVLCGGLHLAIPLMTRAAQMHQPTLSNVAQNLLLEHTPLTASMVNSVMIFTGFALSLPALLFPSTKPSKYFLSLHAYFVLISTLFTLALGLKIWFSTLQTRANLAPIWSAQSDFVQSMLQYKFQCCGYSDSAVFVKDTVCQSVGVAAQLGPCVVPFSSFADRFLDLVFTAFFGFVAVDVILLLSALCLMKDRKEKVRYKLIDEKAGFGPI